MLLYSDLYDTLILTKSKFLLCYKMSQNYLKIFFSIKSKDAYNMTIAYVKGKKMTILFSVIIYRCTNISFFNFVHAS